MVSAKPFKCEVLTPNFIIHEAKKKASIVASISSKRSEQRSSSKTPTNSTSRAKQPPANSKLSLSNGVAETLTSVQDAIPEPGPQKISPPFTLNLILPDPIRSTPPESVAFIKPAIVAKPGVTRIVPTLIQQPSISSPKTSPVAFASTKLPETSKLGDGGLEALAVSSSRAIIFSLDIRQDNMYLATGGADLKVKIWGIPGILNSSPQEKPGDPPRLIASANRHKEPVMCVRWSPMARKLLASSSDSGSIILWEYNTNSKSTAQNCSTASQSQKSSAGKRQDELSSTAQSTHSKQVPKNDRSLPSTSRYNAEKEETFRLKSIKELKSSSQMDIVDLAWSSSGKKLASCSMDCTVEVWCTDTYNRVGKCLHTSYVRGICYNPGGKLLLSQSDDGSAVIWNTATWKRCCTITHPFSKNPSGGGYVRRPSWSADGKYVALPGTVSNGVNVATVLDCEAYESSKKAINFVGHACPVTVAKFSPIIYRSGEEKCYVLALGCEDGTLSLWAVGASPLLVLERLFDSQITDITWAPNGTMVLASSEEGRVAGVRVQHLPHKIAHFAVTNLPKQCIVESLNKTCKELILKSERRSKSRATSKAKTSPQTSKAKLITEVEEEEELPLAVRRFRSSVAKKPRLSEEYESNEHFNSQQFFSSLTPGTSRINYGLYTVILNRETCQLSVSQPTQGTSSKIWTTRAAPGTLYHVDASSDFLVCVVRGEGEPHYLYTFSVATGDPVIQGLALKSAIRHLVLKANHLAILTTSGCLMHFDLRAKRCLLEKDISYIAIHSHDTSLELCNCLQNKFGYVPSIKTGQAKFTYSPDLKGFVREQRID